MDTHQATRRYRIVMTLFITGLLLSGITAFPLLHEMRLLTHVLGINPAANPESYGGLSAWLLKVRLGLEATYAQYPWIAYGTDWLAFGHIIIALFFVPCLTSPAASRPTLRVGMTACVLVFPLAFICGALRGIPLYWRLIDCSFGVFGILPLIYCHSLLRHIMAHREPAPKQNVTLQR